MTQTNGVWVYDAAIPSGQTNVVLYFHNGAGTLDNNGGANWSLPISECQIPSYADTTPTIPTNCEDVVVTYWPGTGPLKTTDPIRIHIGHDGWQDVISPDPVMTNYTDGSWSYTYTPLEGTLQINFVFTDGTNVWDNNGGNDWAVPMLNCSATITQDICIAYGHPVVTADPAGQNNVGDNFDFNVAGGSATTVSQGGFGSFGQIYVNYDETNFYIGATGCDVAGNNNGMVLFLDFNTLDHNKGVLWDLSGSPVGVDQLHNEATSELMDMVLVLGDEFGDGNFPSFNLGSGNDFGQGIYYLGSNSFVQVTNAILSQFDGTGTTPTSSADDDSDTQTERWEACIPWEDLGATGIIHLTSCRLAGLIANADDNGINRYLSGNYLALSASASQPLDGFNNFATNFVTLDPIEVCLFGADTDNDTIPDVAETLRGLDPTNINDADDDRDNDGFSNKNEYHANTDLDDPNSLLIATSADVLPSGGFKVTWQSEFLAPGKSYSIYRTTSMTTSFAFLVGGLPATPPINEYIDASASGGGSYYYFIAVE